MNLKTCIFSLALLGATALAAQQDSIEYWRGQGIESFDKQQFEAALTEFRLALTFEGNHEDIDLWIDKTFDGYVVLLKKEIRGSELAGMAYKLARTNPTHALRVAEEAVKLHPSSSSANQQLHDILSAYPPDFYARKFIHHEGVSAIAISPDNQWILTACMDDTARLWSRTGQLLRSFPHDEPARAVTFFPGGQRLATAGADNVVKIWSADGALLHTLEGHRGDISALALSPDGKLLATAGWDSTFILWNLEADTFLRRKAHDGYLSAIAFSPGGRRLATGGWDKKAKVWSLDGSLLRVLEGHETAVSALDFAGDSRLITGSWDGAAKMWSLDSGDEILSLPRQGDGIQALAYFNRGGAIFTACYDGIIRLWSAAGELIQEYKGHGAWAWCLSLSDDENYLASGAASGEALLWPLKTLESKMIQAHNGEALCLAFSPDGKTLASGGQDGAAKLWTPDGRLLATFPEHQDPVKDIAFSPDGATVASVGDDQLPRFWSHKGSPVRTGGVHSGRLERIIFSRDGQHYFTAGWDGSAYRWNSRDSIIQAYAGHRSRILDMALSPDEQWLATASRDHTAMLWPVAGGQAAQVLEGHQGPVWGIDFSPGGQQIATAGADGTARIWNRKGELLALLQGHENEVTDIQFSPDGRYLLTGSKDGAAKLWDNQGRELQTMRGHAGAVNKVAFSPDGTFMATAGADGTIRFWRFRSQFLSQGELYALSQNEKYKYGLEEGAAVEERPDFDLNAPFYHLVKRCKLLQQEAAPASFNYYNAHTYSRKAYRTRQLGEKLALQQISLQLAGDYKALVEQRLRDSGREGRYSVGAGIRNTLALAHSNLAMWYLLAGAYEEALRHAGLATQQDCQEEVASLVNARLALALLFNEKADEAFALLKENRWSKLESSGFAQILGLMAGRELEGPMLAGELLHEEIAYFQSLGLRHPRLAEFMEMLVVKP